MARVPDDEEGVTALGDRRRHQVRRAHAGPLGQQEQEGLVLDLLEAGEGEGRAAVPVPDEPPELVEQPAVGGVPSGDPNGEPAGGVLALERELAVRAAGDRNELVDLEAEVGERQAHPVAGRGAER
jgi:hypothetical protein